MRVLVIGGTGQIGSLLVANLRLAGVEAVPAARGAWPDGIALDMADAAAVSSAARGFDAVYLTTPIGADETAIGLAAIEGLRHAGVPKIVYLAIHNLESLSEIPHFAAKRPLKRAVLENSRSIVLAPNFFMANDLLFVDAIRDHGVYPLPIGRAGVWSVDVADIAAAAMNALTSPDWDGMTVPVCGPERLTGERLAANWSLALGRPVHYAGDDIRPFLGGLARALPFLDAWLAFDFEVMMRVTQREGCPASAADQAASRAVIGRRPRSHAHFTAAQARAWAQQEMPA